MIKYRDKSGQVHEIQDGDLFVTKDKNVDDVFAGDKIKAIISDISSKPLIGRIVPNVNPLACWMFKYKFLEKEHLAPAPDLKDIELIEVLEKDV